MEKQGESRTEPYQMKMKRRSRPVLSTEPGGAGDPYNLSRFVQAQENDYDQAVDHFSEVIGADGTDADAYFGRGQARRCLKEYDAAIKDFTVASLLGGADMKAAALVGRGRVYLERGEPGHAIDDFTEALAHDPDCAPAYMYRSQAFEKSGESALASADKKRAVRLSASRGKAAVKR